MKRGYFCLGHVFVCNVTEVFNKLLDHSSSSQVMFEHGNNVSCKMSLTSLA